MFNSDEFDIEGRLAIREFSKETGELLYENEDLNVITELGKNTLFLRAVMDDDTTTMKLKNFFIGIDYGDEEDPNGGWTVFNPRPARKTFTSLNQYVVHEVPAVDMVFDYPDANTFQAGTLLDGKYILDTFYPDDVDIRYTSATLRFENDTTFSFKRFPVRSLSRLIDVQLVWTFRIIAANDYICPIPDVDSLIYTYSLENNLNRYDISLNKGSVSSASDIVDVKVRPNGDVFFVDVNNNLNVFDENLGQITAHTLTMTNQPKMFDMDAVGNIYVAQTGSPARIAKFDSDGNQLWDAEVYSSGEIRDIWCVDATRIAVSIEGTDYNLGTSTNRIIIMNSTATVIYNTTVDIGNGQSGDLNLFSSSGGELFATAQNPAGGTPIALIKLNFDLTEISRLTFTDPIVSYHAIEGNQIVIGVGGSNPRLIQYDADLNFIRDMNLTNTPLAITSDKDGYVYVAFNSSIIKVSLDGTIHNTSPATSGTPKTIQAVGSKWSYFGA